MSPPETYPHEAVHQAEYRLLDSKLQDLKERVEKVETTLGRGVLLLVANLAGVVMTLAQDWIQS